MIIDPLKQQASVDQQTSTETQKKAVSTAIMGGMFFSTVLNLILYPGAIPNRTRLLVAFSSRKKAEVGQPAEAI